MPLGAADVEADETPALAAAQRLWARCENHNGVSAPLTIVADRVYTGLRTELGRWIGVEGLHSLLARSLAVARAECPALSGLTHLGGEDPVISAAVKLHGADVVADGLVSVLVHLTELLGRVVGAELAVHLLDQVEAPSTSSLASTESEDPSDD